MSVITYTKGTKKKLTANFNLSEMHCHGIGCCNSTKLDIKIVKYAQKMRDILGVPITIESAYRCPTHNVAVQGAIGSGHTYGTALDLTTLSVSRARLSVLAELIGVPRIGIYLTDNKTHMVHIGLGTKSHWINTGNYQKASHSFLNGAWAKPVIKVSAKSNKKYIRYVQACLFVKGYYTGTIDGCWGEKTQTAINKYRKAKGWKKATYLKSSGINQLLK